MKMASVTAFATPAFLPHSSPAIANASASNPRFYLPANSPSNPFSIHSQILTNLSAFSPHHRHGRMKTNPGLRKWPASRAASSSSEYAEEPKTKVKFRKSLEVPGCPSSLTLLGIGYREKVFALIGVKVYAAGLYTNPLVFSKLDAWKGHAYAELEKDPLVFNSIFQAPLEKALHIILVRDVDGKTFWDALSEAISPRVKSPTLVDEFALSTFRNTFESRPLKKGTSVFLTWLDTTKMLVSISPDETPSTIDATIESSNVTSALFDVFLGSNSVSPSLKASASSGLAAALK